MATSQEITTASSCYFGCISPGMQPAAILYLLNQLQETPMTTQEIIDGARCIDSCIPDGMKPAAMIYLLENLHLSGGAGRTGNGSPEGMQAASPGTTYLDLDTNNFWVKATGTGNTGWVELISSP